MFYRILELSNKTTVKKHITKYIYNLSYLMATWNPSMHFITSSNEESLSMSFILLSFAIILRDSFKLFGYL